MLPEINYWAAALATASSMLVGAAWYAPSGFGTTWANQVGIDLKNPPRRPAIVFPPVIVLGFFTACALSFFTTVTAQYLNLSFLATAFLVSTALWVGFTASRFIVHDLFENRAAKLSAINVGHELVNVNVMAAAIGLLPI